MRVDVLGPLRVVAGSDEVVITSARERALLAVLGLHANELVLVERLVEAIWGDRPPRGVRNQVQLCVSRLRKRLAGVGVVGEVIVTDSAGYRLRVDPSGVDLCEFRRLVAEGRAAAAGGRAAEARDRYRAGLGLWRGPVLAGVDSDVIRQAVAGLEEERLRAVEECVEVELGLGAAGELVAELTELVREHPFRESLHGVLMRALYGAGRQADALAAYRRLRELLHDELGTEPGPEIQRLHRSILNRDLEVVAPSGGRGAPVPRELPAVARCFAGREAGLARVRSVLTSASGSRPAVVVLYGPGGVGKSALAVRAGHDLVAEFPDGQLYVDLFGSTPGMRPLPALEALGRCLRGLGVHPAEIPSGEVEAAALFRSVTVDRRLLLVLDNAADRGQVGALVPSGAGCAVLVTSRQPLGTLDADDRLRVDPLPEASALELLAGLTPGRTVLPDTGEAIVSHTGGLPLAVRIAAGRLASRPDLSAREYATRLADRSRRLDELQLDDLAVRASIRTGYDALLSGGGPGLLAAWAFRALGVLHVPDVAPGVVAAMLAEPDVDTVRGALDRLVDAQLLEPMAGGRYRLHDLVRLVATERATDEDGPADREQMLYRAIAYYTGALWRAEAALRPLRTLPFKRLTIPDGVHLPEVATREHAGTLVEMELPNAVATLEQACATGYTAGSMVLWLGDVAWQNLDTHCDWSRAHRISQLILDAAIKQGDRELRAWGLLLRGRSQACLSMYESATDDLESALHALRGLGNDLGAALALNGIGVVSSKVDQPAEALTRYAEALRLARDEDRSLAATILSNMCVTYAMLGNLREAVRAAEECLAVGGMDSTVYVGGMINLASVQCLAGSHADAVRRLDAAVTLNEEAGDRIRLCETLITRSEAYRRWGNLTCAAADAERALVEAQAWGYRYVAAAARDQRAKIMAAMGREPEAVRERALADGARAELTDTYRDIMIDLLMMQDESSEDGYALVGTNGALGEGVDARRNGGGGGSGRRA